MHAAIAERAENGDRLLWVVSPFVKRVALERLLQQVPPSDAFKLIARWRPSDLVSGVSDLGVYDYMKGRDCELYVHPRIHLKLYVFESNVAFSSSGNVTDRGLGYCDMEAANVEVGTQVELSASDWIELYRVVGGSRLITPELYARFEQYVSANEPPQRDTEPDLLGPSKIYTLASLPATETPSTLAEIYLSGSSTGYPSDVMRRVYHDLATFGIRDGLNRGEFDVVLGASFRQNAFVKEFLGYLQAHGSLRFGAVNDWIHQTCEDVPLPYRWEVKPSTRILYNWLEHYFPEVTWSRPNHSQVLFWRVTGDGSRNL